MEDVVPWNQSTMAQLSLRWGTASGPSRLFEELVVSLHQDDLGTGFPWTEPRDTARVI